ncbi:hypothetical protein ACET3Z_017196 [Daucus carota]
MKLKLQNTFKRFDEFFDEDMFAAVTDTTFITLDWGMTVLIINPRVMQKAQAEEIFRLHPVPVLVPRESMDDVKIDGYDIPAKTRFYVNAWAIGRDLISWKDTESFEPERFIRSSTDFRGQDFELLPFGAGRRGCPAIVFGTAVIELALAQLLHSFDWELPAGIQANDLDMTKLFGISMHRVAHLVVVAKPHFA